MYCMTNEINLQNRPANFSENKDKLIKKYA